MEILIIFFYGVVGTRPVELNIFMLMTYIVWEILGCCDQIFVSLYPTVSLDQTPFHHERIMFILGYFSVI